LFIKKNKYLLYLVLFLFALQIVPCCSEAFAIEKQANIASRKQISTAPATKQELKVLNKKKLYKRYYKKQRPKYTSQINPSMQSGLNNKVKDKKIDKLPTIISEQKELNLKDFPGKKYSSENMQKYKPDNGFNFLSVLSSLFFVILLVIIFGWFYSKLRNVDPASLLAGKFSDKSPNRFNIISTATLGQGKNIHLVEINGKHLVIGSTINNISLLTELNSYNKTITEKNTYSDSSDNSDENDDDFIEPSNYTDIYKEYLKDKDSKE